MTIPSLREISAIVDDAPFTRAEIDGLEKRIAKRCGREISGHFAEFVGQRKTFDVLAMIQDKIGQIVMSMSDAEVAEARARGKAISSDSSLAGFSRTTKAVAREWSRRSTGAMCSRRTCDSKSPSSICSPATEDVALIIEEALARKPP